jgi:hypothetical protein
MNEDELVRIVDHVLLSLESRLGGLEIELVAVVIELIAGVQPCL